MVEGQAPGLLHFIRATREPVDGDAAGVRLVYRSELIRHNDGLSLDSYITDCAPLFYRRIDAIIEDLKAGYFMTAVRSTLARLPTSESFQESHFGEIVAGLFARQVLGLRLLYSKLCLLTAENANAYKMDLVMYDASADPLRFVFGEVKCSPKGDSDGLPAKHDESCFAAVFKSMNSYSKDDCKFDLTAARDNLDNIPVEDRDRVRTALMPYSGAIVAYAGFVVIDSSTYDDGEVQVLRTRANPKEFQIDLICLESYSVVAGNVYQRLRGTMQAGLGDA